MPASAYRASHGKKYARNCKTIVNSCGVLSGRGYFRKGLFPGGVYSVGQMNRVNSGRHDDVTYQNSFVTCMYVNIARVSRAIQTK